MKKFNKIIWLLPVLLIVGMLAGCRTQPVYNVNNASVVAAIPGQKAVSRNTVKNAITQATRSLGWHVKNVRPGLIVATLYLRGHVAAVSIPYNNKTYSIQYRSSKNLDYNGKVIHRNYNGWVKNLNRAIKAALSVSQ